MFSHRATSAAEPVSNYILVLDYSQHFDWWLAAGAVSNYTLVLDYSQCGCQHDEMSTMKPVYNGHPSGPNQLAAILRWPGYTVKPVYNGHPSGPNQLTAILRWPDYTVKPVVTPRDPTN